MAADVRVVPVVTPAAACDDRGNDPFRSVRSSVYAVRRLYRDPGDRLVAGVASGIAEHLGLPAVAVRIAFVVLLPFGGLGAVMYAVFWAVLPTAPTAVPARRRKGRMLLYLVLACAILALQQATGIRSGLNNALGWLAAVIAIGAGTIWHLADPNRRRRLWSGRVHPPAPSEDSDRRWFLLRIVGGGACVIVGVIGVALV